MKQTVSHFYSREDLFRRITIAETAAQIMYEIKYLSEEEQIELLGVVGDKEKAIRAGMALRDEVIAALRQKYAALERVDYIFTHTDGKEILVKNVVQLYEATNNPYYIVLYDGGRRYFLKSEHTYRRAELELRDGAGI